MSQARPVAPGRTQSLWAAGASIFAGTLMLIAGVFQFIEGLTALINGTDFLVKTPNFLFTFNATTWGWIHLILGLVLALAGGFIFTGNLAARSVGIAAAILSAIANFMWLPYYPLWGIIVIALDIFIVWGLTKSNLGEM